MHDIIVSDMIRTEHNHVESGNKRLEDARSPLSFMQRLSARYAKPEAPVTKSRVATKAGRGSHRGGACHPAR